MNEPVVNKTPHFCRVEGIIAAISGVSLSLSLSSGNNETRLSSCAQGFSFRERKKVAVDLEIHATMGNILSSTQIYRLLFLSLKRGWGSVLADAANNKRTEDAEGANAVGVSEIPRENQSRQDTGTSRRNFSILIISIARVIAFSWRIYVYAFKIGIYFCVIDSISSAEICIMHWM